MEQYLDFKSKIDNEKLKEAAQAIKDGKIAVFPTETVYGIGADCLNEEAIKKLYKAKRRPLTQKISILVGSIQMLEEVTKNITNAERALINKFFPGPLTLILHKKDIIPYILTNNEEVVGFRMPTNEIALELINSLGNPIATSSANKAGEPSGVKIENIMETFKNEVDVYIDGGKSKIGIGSTIVQIIDEKPIIIREGIITKKEIEKVINDEV